MPAKTPSKTASKIKVQPTSPYLTIKGAANAMALYLHDLVPDFDVITFHFRGYRPSSGRPRGATLTDDSLEIGPCPGLATLFDGTICLRQSTRSEGARYRHRLS